MKKTKTKKKALMTSNRFRSGLERRIANLLRECKITFGYEPKKLWFRYRKPVSKYKPDFVLGNGIVVEAKGFFKPADRAKHLLLQKQHPDIDIRFVFSNSKNRLSPKSYTTYAMWCEKYGFMYADRLIPISWMKEGIREKSLKAIEDCYE